MLNRLVELSLRYKFLVLIIFAVVAFLGISAVRSVPIDAFPDVTPAQVNVYTESPGLAAEDVEQLLTTPVERVMFDMYVHRSMNIDTPPQAPARRAPVGGSLRPWWSSRSSPPASRPTTFVTTHRRRPPVLRPVWATLRRSAVNSCPPAAQRPPVTPPSHPAPSTRRSTGRPAATA